MTTLDKWDLRFLELAELVASWSKDPSTHVGAILTKDKRVLGLGFNGLPSALKDDEKVLSDRALRLSCTVHAEVNAVLHAPSDLTGASIYTTFFPCNACTTVLISRKLARVVAKKHGNDTRYAYEFDRSKQLLDQAKIAWVHC